MDSHEQLGLAGSLMRERVRARLLGATPRTLRVGRFELERACGRGGEGQVFAARDTVSQALVALKCLNSVRVDEQPALQREFRALSGIVHPNLVSMHELFCVDGAWFFTMELLEGVDLTRYVAAQRDRTSATREVLRQLLSALAAIHDAGFVHRDVKPSNVLVEASGRVVLVDFGLVVAGEVVRAGSAGTPAYMAPEQHAGAAPRPAADLYAVGAILYELLCGRRLSSSTHAERARALTGDPALCALCQALLAEEASARPSAHQALALLGVRSTRRAPMPSPRFVGRAHELGWLMSAWSALCGPRIVLVHGESGIGKSALLAEFARRLPADALLFRERCYERESTPFKPFEGLLTHAAAWGDRAAPTARDDARQQLFAGLRARLREAGRPIVVLVDDLQWADLDSIALLEGLFARGSDLPILLVGNYRRGEASTHAFLSALLAPRTLAPPLCPLDELALEPLAANEAHELAEALAGRPIEPALIDSARGVPFMVVEAALAEQVPGASAADALLDQRLSGLGPPARRLLELLSVAGRPLPIALALGVADAPFEAALELASARCVRFRDLAAERCLEPYHDRVRERVRVPPQQARSLHRQLADGMERLGLNAPLRRVEHLRAAGEDTRAAALALRAAELACAQLAFSHAADLLAFALALGHGQRRRLADVLAFAGRHAEAAAQYLRAITPETAGELMRLAAQQYARAGQTERSIALLWRGLSDVGVHLPLSTWRACLAVFPSRVRALHALAHLDRPTGVASEPRLRWLETVYRELWLSHPVHSSLAHDRYVREARNAGPHEKMMALTMEAVVRTVADGPDARSEPLLQRAEALASDSPYERALLLIARGLAALHTEWRPRAAIAPLEQADALLTTCPGTQFEREWAGFALDHALELSGQLRAFSELVRERQQRDPRHPMRAISVPVVMLIDDRADDALALLSAERPYMPFLEHITLSRAVSVWLYKGDPAAALAHFEAGARRMRFELARQSRLLRESTAFERARCAAALYVATGDRRWKRTFARRAARSLPPVGRAHLRMLEASMARAEGDHAACASLLRAARGAYERGQCGHGVACARYREAQLARNSVALQRARDWFLRQGVIRPERWVEVSGYWG